MTPCTAVVARPATRRRPYRGSGTRYLIPPLPVVAFEVIRLRDGSPGPLPAPTPGPEAVPTPAPGLMSF